jgi:hypothetical protein
MLSGESGARGMTVARHRRRGMGCGDPVAGRRGARRLGTGGRGHDRVRCERIGTGRIKVDETDYEQVVRTRQRCDAHTGKTN